MFKFMIDRIVHDNHTIEGAISRIEQTFIYFQLENKVMTLFSCLAIIFLPPTLISGAFGMNVDVPFQTSGANDDDAPDSWSVWFNDNNGPFFTIVLISVMISALLLLLFYKYNML